MLSSQTNKQTLEQQYKRRFTTTLENTFVGYLWGKKKRLSLIMLLMHILTPGLTIMVQQSYSRYIRFASTIWYTKILSHY